VKFTKELLRPASYHIPYFGGKQLVHFDKDRVARIGDTVQRMIESGIQIPVPTRHLDEAVPVRLAGDADDLDTYNNTGWLTEVKVGGDGSLYGTLDIKDEQVASKIKSGTIKHVSPVVSRSWLDTETGESYEDAMTHVALVTHPVQKDQSGFVSDENRVAFSIADIQPDVPFAAPPFSFEHFSVPESERTDSSVQTVIKYLAAKGINLPGDTDATNFIERLGVAVMNWEPNKAETDDNMTNPPEGSSVKQPQDPAIATAGVAFSQEQQEIVTKLAQQKEMLEHFVRQAAEEKYASRIKACIESGRCGQDEANKHLLPHLKSYNLQLSQGEPQKQTLDFLLEMVEGREVGSSVTVKQGAEGKVKLSMGGLDLTEDFRLAEPPAEQDPDVADPAAELPMSEDDVTQTVDIFKKMAAGSMFAN
jgi:hypothetical protein